MGRGGAYLDGEAQHRHFLGTVVVHREHAQLRVGDLYEVVPALPVALLNVRKARECAVASELEAVVVRHKGFREEARECGDARLAPERWAERGVREGSTG